MAVLLCMLSVSNAVWASDKEDGILRYNIPVIAGAERFVDILAYPAYMAIALQNIGIRVSISSDVKIKDHQTFEIKGTEIKLIKKVKNVFFYQAKLSGAIGNIVPVVDLIVDASTIKNGMVILSASSSILKVLPMSLRDMIDTKILLIGNEYNQKKSLEYYNKLSNASYGHNKIQGVLDGIMIDAYNMHININDQNFMADTESSKLNYYWVFIFIGIVFIFIVIIYVRAKK